MSQRDSGEGGSTAAARVILDAAGAGDAPLLENLLELYMHDLSGIFSLDLGADGRFEYPDLPLYWREVDRRFAFVIRVDGNPAGFALATRGSPASDDPEDLDLAEFFVVKRHRRSGVGRRAAFALWEHLPGTWVVRVAERNTRGLPFWRTVVPEYSRGLFTLRTLTLRSQPWSIFRFTCPPAVGTV
jgi:predicted acetyltransferase